MRARDDALASILRAWGSLSTEARRALATLASNAYCGNVFASPAVVANRYAIGPLPIDYLTWAMMAEAVARFGHLIQKTWRRELLQQTAKLDLNALVSGRSKPGASGLNWQINKFRTMCLDE